MDHKVSKDMISSGMTPSGEKTQADLGRIQYGSNPSPSSLADAYKSMYGKKEEVINEMRLIKPSFKNLSGRQKRIQKTPRGGSQGSGVYDATTGGKNDSQSIDAKVSNVSGPGQGKPMVGKVTTRKVDPQTLKKNPRGDIQTNSFDLLAAYHAVYEHHKKDADGNTIPHEGEEINEAAPLLAAPLIAKGLMALKGTKAVAAAVKGASAFKKGLTTAKAVGAAGKITTTGGKLASGTKKVGMMQKAGSGLRSAGASIKNNPTNTALVGSMAIPQGRGSTPQPTDTVQQTKLGRRTAGMYNDVDLFDIVKGHLLDEGLNEKEVTDVMTTLTLEEINEVIQINEISAALLKRASISAGNKAMQLASKKDSAGAVKKLEQQKKFSGAMKQKNLATSRAENMRKPTGPMANRPQPDPTKPYPGTPR